MTDHHRRQDVKVTNSRSPLNRLTCLVPAYNEAGEIGKVLKTILEVPQISRIVVVDDGSDDGTADIVRSFQEERLCLISLPHNRGKSFAVACGMEKVETEFVLLLDADLVGLTRPALVSLIQPVLQGKVKVSISLRGKTMLPWRAIGIDYISGERVLPADIFAGRLETIRHLTPFGLEVFLNDLIIEYQLPLLIVSLKDVESPNKIKKRGLIRGVKADMDMVGDILQVISLPRIVNQIVKLKQLDISQTSIPERISKGFQAVLKQQQRKRFRPFLSLRQPTTRSRQK